MVLGNNGIIKKAIDAKIQTEKTRLKEEADLIKTDLVIEENIGENTLTRYTLAEKIQEQMGGTLKGPKVTTKDGKYDIYVKSDLEIIVEKHIEETSSDEFEVLELADGTLAVIKYNGTNPILNIPREIEVNGEYKTVTQIGSEDADNIIGWEDAFLEQLTLPDTLKRIEDWALAMCFNKEVCAKITIPEGVVFLGEATFYGNDLAEVIVPDSITEVGEMVFQDNKLKNINIPKGINKIPFAYASFNNITEMDIPNNITSIDDCAFLGNEITELDIPTSVTEIGERAFNSNKITKLNIPTSVKKMGVGAFSNNCLEESKAYIYNLDSNGIEDRTTLNSYAGNSTTTTIPTGIISIGENAFMECENLVSLTLPNSVTTIGEDSFYNCKSLESINIPDSVTTIGESAFLGCTSLASINIPEGVTKVGQSTFFGCTSLNSVSLPNGVTEIQYSAFKSCPALTSLTIPNSITSIDVNAFGSKYDREDYTTAVINIDKAKDEISGAPWGIRSPGKIVWNDGEETAGAQY